MGFLNKSLLNFNPPVFGLDICDRSIKAVELQRSRRKIDLKSYSCGEIPPGIVENGEIIDSKKMAEIIKQITMQAKPAPIKTKNAVCSIVESRCFVRVVSVPLMNEEDLEDAINLEAEEYFPLAREDMHIDWQIVSGASADTKSADGKLSNNNKIEVLLGAVPKSLVDLYLETLANCDLNPIVIEIEPVATARCLIGNDMYDKDAMIIDLGGQRTSFIITKGDIVYFTSGISTFCGDVLSAAISRELKTSKEDAIQIKNTCGFDKSKLEGKVFRILSPYISELVIQAKRVLGYYSEHKTEFSSLSRSSGNISKVLLCGGGASLRGLDIFLARQLRVPVEIGNPWINIYDKEDKKIPLISRENSLYFSTALGSAMRGIK